MNITKDMIGKTLVLLPEGNNLTKGRDRFSEAIEVEILQVRGKKLELIKKATDESESRYITPMSVTFKAEPQARVYRSEFSHWLVFEGWDDFNTFKIGQLTRARLMDALMYRSGGVTDEHLKQFAEIMKWDDILNS